MQSVLDEYDERDRRAKFSLFYFVAGVSVVGAIAAIRGTVSLDLLTVAPLFVGMMGWYIGRPLVAAGTSFWRERDKTMMPPEDRPSVTVQMPAYNEADTIRRSVESACEQAYAGDLEVVVVDDGSTDATYDILRSLADENPELSIATKPNSGIGPTRNRALEIGSGEIVVTMDSDTILETGAIDRIVDEFDDDVVGVATNVEIGNDEASWWTRAQSYEYLVSMEMARKFQSRFRHLMVISGGCGAYRRSVLETIGGWSDHGNTYAEDFDMTIRAHEHGHIAFSPAAIALTEGPSTLRGWWEQRMMWAGRGLRTVLHHRDVFFDGDYNLLGYIALPLKLGLSGLMVYSVANGLYDAVTVASVDAFVGSVIGVYGATLAFTSGLALLTLGIVSTYANHTSPLRKLGTLPAYLLVYRQLHVAVRIVAFASVLTTMCYEGVARRLR